jgi:hypothetical protein
MRSAEAAASLLDQMSTRRKRSACAMHTFTERFRWSNSGVKVLLEISQFPFLPLENFYVLNMLSDCHFVCIIHFFCLQLSLTTLEL